MQEERKETQYSEEECDFSYLAKLSQAYKQAQAERRKVDLGDEKRQYLITMQRELFSIGKHLLHFYLKNGKKELAAMLMTNAERLLHALSEEPTDAANHPIDNVDATLLTRAVLLANRSLITVGATGKNGELFHMILSEISALYALNFIG